MRCRLSFGVWPLWLFGVVVSRWSLFSFVVCCLLLKNRYGTLLFVFFFVWFVRSLVCCLSFGVFVVPCSLFVVGCRLLLFVVVCGCLLFDVCCCLSVVC